MKKSWRWMLPGVLVLVLAAGALWYVETQRPSADISPYDATRGSFSIHTSQLWNEGTMENVGYATPPVGLHLLPEGQ